MFLLLHFCTYGQLLELKLLAFLSGTLHILLFISAYRATKWWWWWWWWRWQRKPASIDMERNYVTVTLCVKRSRVHNRTLVFSRGCLLPCVGRTTVSDSIQWLWATCGWVFLEVVSSLMESCESQQQLHGQGLHQQHCVRCAATESQASFRYHVGSRATPWHCPDLCASMSTAAFQKFWIPLALSSRPNCRPGGKWWQPIPPGLWLTPPAGWLPRTGISSGTLRSVIEYRLPFYFCVCIFISES